MLLKIVKIGLSRLAVRLHYSFADYECHSLGPLLFSFMIIEVVEVVSTECCKELQNSCTALFSLTCSAGSDFRGGRVVTTKHSFTLTYAQNALSIP